ncbi:aminotransferase class I and II domain-containing protein [Phthorimaea operculella]|nr:aminotransferase class I and II domain-containing protein [Phthorimaea operculella]
MILVDIYDMASWWTLVIALQVVLTTYFLYTRKKSKKRDHTECNGKDVHWKPLPLIEHEVKVEEPPLMGKIDENVLNVGATSFLNMDKEESIMEKALEAISKYGVGSCGPRGFYGTIDVHLELEERLAKFLEVDETCVYSYGFSTIASAIPAYAKKNDIIFVDEKVWFAIQKGLDAARSTIRYFRHNDADHLEELLSQAAKKKELNPKRRAFLVTEAIFYNTGEMCPLKRIVQLARKYKLRIILDESMTIGVIGKHGRGITEHLDIPRGEIDLIVGSLEHSFASVGGFCAGTEFIVEHNRLSGLGYCFSASLPPLLTQAAISALDILEQKPEYISELEVVSKKLNNASLPPLLTQAAISALDILEQKPEYISELEVVSKKLNNMLTQAAISALDILEQKPEYISELEVVSKKLNKALSQLKYYKFRGDEISPVKHIYLKKDDLTDRLKHSYLKNITNYCLEKGIAMTVAAYLRDLEHSCPEPSIRLASNRKLNDESIKSICELLDEAYEKVGPRPELLPVS